MLSQFTLPRRARQTLAVSLCAGLSACAFGDGVRDVDRNPIANTGAGASIIYPGQGAPTYESGGQFGPRGGIIGTGPAVEGQAPVQQAQAGDPYGQGSGSSSRSGSPSGGGGGVTFLGGTEQDEVSHAEFNEEPVWFKYVALPFVLAAAPFKLAADSVMGDAEPGPEVPRNTLHSRLPAASNGQPSKVDTGRAPNSYANGAPQPAPRIPTAEPTQPAYAAPAPSQPGASGPAMDYESVLLRKMERELAMQGPDPSQTSAGSAYSIADELASLQRSAPAPRQYVTATPTPMPQPAVEQRSSQTGDSLAADGIVDRNGDGRIDQWIYRANGQLKREVLDDDFDGRGERTILYDERTHEVTRVEEDFDHDNAIDSWTDYQHGHVVRRRSDANSDGSVDSWTFYRDGEVSRHERDTTGDGFRDRVGYYRAGQLSWEEQDHDGDGRADVIVRYDAGEQISAREEDVDGDGDIDLISRFDRGKLTSREVIDPAALQNKRR